MDNGPQSLLFQTIKSTSGPDLLWILRRTPGSAAWTVRLPPYPTAAQLAAVADAPASETQYMCLVDGTGRLPEKPTQNYD